MKNYLEQLKHLLKPEPEESEDRSGLTTARAALLLAISQADHDESAPERERVMQLLMRRLGMPEDEAIQLLEEAAESLDQSVSLYDFTRDLRLALAPAERLKLMEDLWQVAFADGQLDPHEEHLLRRVNDLLGVPQRGFIQAKLRSANAAS